MAWTPAAALLPPYESTDAGTSASATTATPPPSARATMKLRAREGRNLRRLLLMVTSIQHLHHKLLGFLPLSGRPFLESALELRRQLDGELLEQVGLHLRLAGS